MEHHSLRETAAVGLSLLDLTNLDDNCTPAAVDALCDRAQTPFGHVAAVCILPRFVPQARLALGSDHRIRIATVVNFPTGAFELADVVPEARQAVADGADEIDLVIPYQALRDGETHSVSDMVDAVRQACGAPVVLKAILETGELKDSGLIRDAARLAIAAGADFIKTSTGKTAVGATLEAADIMLRVIRESGGKVGFKPSGGVSSVADAALYLSLAATIMTPDWAMPSTFRFGASALLDDILSILGGTAPATRATGY